MMKKNKLYTLVIFFLIGFALSFGQTKLDYSIKFDQQFKQYSINKWKVEEGLPSNLVQKIFMSKTGEIWISTVNGIAKFNGIDFRIYNKYNTEEITAGYFREIDEDESGTLWMSTKGDGILSFRNGKFKSWTKNSGQTILEDLILVDSKNRVWACDADKGLFFLENGVIKFVNIKNN